MAEYKVSPPAEFAAQVLDAHFAITEVPGGKIAATVLNMAKIIDLKTKAFRVRPALQQAMAKINYLDPGELKRNIHVVRDAVRSLEMMADEMPRWEEESAEFFRDQVGIEARMSAAERERHRQMAHEYQVSAAAASAVRELARHFDFIERPEGQITCTENNLCILVDTCTNMWLVHERLMRLVAATQRLDAIEFAKQEPIVRDLFRELDYALGRMPSGPQQLNIGRHKKTDISGMFTPQQMKNRRIVEQALSKSRTPEQAQQVLINATKDKLL